MIYYEKFCLNYVFVMFEKLLLYQPNNLTTMCKIVVTEIPAGQEMYRGQSKTPSSLAEVDFDEMKEPGVSAEYQLHWAGSYFSSDKKQAEGYGTPFTLKARQNVKVIFVDWDKLSSPDIKGEEKAEKIIAAMAEELGVDAATIKQTGLVAFVGSQNAIYKGLEVENLFEYVIPKNMLTDDNFEIA